MVDPDRRQDRGEWMEEIGGVETAAKTGLDNRDVRVRASDIVECHGRGRLEKRRAKSLDHGNVIANESCHVVFADRLPVADDAFAKVHQVRRGIRRDAKTVVRQEGGGGGDCTSLAVGAGDVEAGNLLMRIAKRVQQRKRAFETEPDPAGGPGIKVFECLGVLVHGERKEALTAVGCWLLAVGCPLILSLRRPGCRTYAAAAGSRSV